MKTEKMIVVFSIVLGLLLGFGDAILDHFLFHARATTSNFVLHGICIVAPVVVGFSAFGIFMSRLLSGRRRAEDALQHTNQLLGSIRKAQARFINEGDSRLVFETFWTHWLK